ncbi:MAG: hypothetical protein NVS1B14_02470 [Vulcanimicrobiaceae bacterium]
MFAVVDHDIDPGALVAAVRDDRCGAVVLFFGTVRAESGRFGEVHALTYEAYAEAAIGEMRTIAAETAARWKGCRLAMIHRTGTLPVGATSVGVAAAMPHRAEAFDACRFAIDQLKERVPIWKKEHRTDGTSGWKDQKDGDLR